MIQHSRGGNNSTVRPRRTGYPAFAGYDDQWSRLAYNAASTAFVTSAVPLLPPNSIGLMPPA
jgi:hypothetical protein